MVGLGIGQVFAIFAVSVVMFAGYILHILFLSSVTLVWGQFTSLHRHRSELCEG